MFRLKQIKMRSQSKISWPLMGGALIQLLGVAINNDNRKKSTQCALFNK